MKRTVYYHTLDGLVVKAEHDFGSIGPTKYIERFCGFEKLVRRMYEHCPKYSRHALDYIEREPIRNSWDFQTNP